MTRAPKKKNKPEDPGSALSRAKAWSTLAFAWLLIAAIAAHIAMGGEPTIGHAAIVMTAGRFVMPNEWREPMVEFLRRRPPRASP